MIYQDDGYTLTSGRWLYSNCGILGLGPDVNEGISEGYDGWVVDTDERPFTKAERIEIATEMVQRWIRWRDLVEL